MPLLDGLEAPLLFYNARAWGYELFCVLIEK
jgi:hypothetical protein